MSYRPEPPITPITGAGTSSMGVAPQCFRSAQIFFFTP
jgi:hypothetical protein